MGDDIYDEQLSYKIDNLIPKLNGLSMNKTGSESDLKSRSGHTNGYVHHNEVKGSCSGSEIVFLNAAMYIEKLDASNPLINGDSQGVVKSKDTEPSSSFILTNNNKIYQIHKASAELSNKKINGVTFNGAGDRLSLLETDNTKTGISHGIKCEKTKLSASLSSFRNHVETDFDKSSFDLCVSSSDENCSSNSFDSSCTPNSKGVALLSKQSSPEVYNFASTDEAKNVNSPLSVFTRTHSDLNRGSAGKFIEKSSTAKCSSLETVKRYSAKLSDENYSNTFPEKSIHKKISSVLIGKSDRHSVDAEEKMTLPENWENLVGNEDLAWHKWYMSKTEQAKKKKEVMEKEESKKKAEEKKQREQRLRKLEIEERAVLSWMEKKEKDRKAKQLDQANKLETERLKKEIDQVNLQKMSLRAHEEWRRRKDKELKEQMEQKKRLLHERDDEERLRSLKSKVAFEVWNENSKNKPKPMSIAIKDNKGFSDPSLSNLKWNPIPWKNILEEPNVSTKKNSKKKTVIKPFSS